MPLVAISESAAQAAEPSARAIYQAHLAYVWNSLRRLGIPEADREDLCHDVFVAFFRGQTAYDPSRPPRPWLFGIAFRVASDHRRRARYTREIPAELDHSASDAPLADEALVRKEARALVERALDALDLDQRAVFILHEIDGLQMPEIVRVLDAPLNTLYSRLRLGRRKFEAEVQRLSARTAAPAVAEGGRR
jgi:RNA polymerase sigma-70 factor (ECF subfamily)